MRIPKTGMAGSESEANKRVLSLQTIERVHEAIVRLKADEGEYYKPPEEQIMAESGVTSMGTVQKVLKLLFEMGIYGKDPFAIGHDQTLRLLVSRGTMVQVRHCFFEQGKVIVEYADGTLIPRAYFFKENGSALYVKDFDKQKHPILNYERSYLGTEKMWLTNFYTGKH